MSVSADVSSALNGLNALNDQVGRSANAFQQAAPAALVFTAAGGAIAGALGGAVKVAADFEQGMANVRAVLSPAEANQFGQALSDLAIKLGRDTVFTSREAAAGIEELVKAGVSAQDILGGAAEAVTNLAAATGQHIPEAATLAATTMNAFGHSATDLNADVDTLAQVINASAADFNDLKFGLATVAPTAHTVGLSFQDTAAAIGLLTNAGQTGQQAGTALRQMLLELTPTTKPATEEMKKLGIITADGKNQFFDATGKIKSMAEIMQILQDATKGMSNEQRLAAFNVIFTRDAINAATILADQGAAGMDRLQQAMQGITAAGTAQERLNSLEGSLKNLGGSVEAAQILIGSAFVPQLRELADHVRDLVNAFTALPVSVQQGVARFAAAAAIVLALTGAFILLAPSIVALPAAFGVMASAFASLLPIIAVAAGIFLVLRQAWERDIGGIREVADHFSNIGDIVQAALSGNVGEAFAGFIEDIKSVSPELRNFIDDMQARFSGLQSFLAPILGNIGLVLDKAFSGNFAGAFDTLQAIITAISPQVGQLIQNFREFATQIGPPIQQGFEAARGYLDAFLQKAGETVAYLSATFGPILEAIGNFVAQNVGPAFQVVAAAVGLLKDTFGGIVENGFKPLKAIIDAFQANPNALPSFFNTLGDALATLGGKIQAVSPVISSLAGLFGAINSLIGTVVQVGFQALIGLFTDVLIPNLDKLRPILTALAAPVALALAPLIAFFNFIAANADTISKAIDQIATAVNNLATAIGSLPANFNNLPGVAGAKAAAGTALDATSSAAQGALNASGAALNTGIGLPGGINVNINGVTINNAGDLNTFSQSIANAIAAASRRVGPPVSNGGFPALEGFT